MLSVEEKKMIATLRDDPSYMILCRHLEEETADILNAMEDVTDPTETIRILHIWQASRKLVARLKTAPETIAEILRQEEEEKQNKLLQDIDDPFARPRYMSPTYQDANINSGRQQQYAAPPNPYKE